MRSIDRRGGFDRCEGCGVVHPDGEANEGKRSAYRVGHEIELSLRSVEGMPAAVCSAFIALA
jgi:hypothetical protein